MKAKYKSVNKLKSVLISAYPHIIPVCVRCKVSSKAMGSLLCRLCIAMPLWCRRGVWPLSLISVGNAGSWHSHGDNIRASQHAPNRDESGGKLNFKNIFQNPVSFNWCPPFSSSLRFKLNIYNSPLLFNCLLSELSISTEDLGSYICLLTILMWDGALITSVVVCLLPEEMELVLYQ